MAEFYASVDRQPVRRGEWGVFAICTAIAFLDGFDVQTMGVAAPALAREWGLAPPALSAVFMAAPAGMVVGALAMGRLADRVGRRRPIIAATLLFAVGTGLTPFAPSLSAMAALRFVTGIGLGGVLPNLVSLVTEFAPQRLCSTVTTLTFSSLPLGSMVAALVARYLIPLHGWPALFYIGGAAPVAMAAVAFLRLPESPGFLARRKRSANGETIARQASLGSLVGPGRTSTTVLLVLVTGFNVFMLYFTLNWLPTLLTLTGLSSERALLATVLVNTSGCLGAITWGRLMDRAGALPVMATAGMLASLGMALLSVGYAHPVLLVAALLVSGMSVMGAVPGLYAVIASVYPTRMRSTGVGAVLGAGRVGSVLGPAAGGLMLALGWSISAMFLAVAALGLGWAVGLWLVQRLPRRFA
jgi:MFS transporter, AAHS family, 4-hydroxybenzoate transporter